MVKVLLAIAIVGLMGILDWTIIVRAFHVLHVGDCRPVIQQLRPPDLQAAFVLATESA